MILIQQMLFLAMLRIINLDVKKNRRRKKKEKDKRES